MPKPPWEAAMEADMAYLQAVREAEESDWPNKPAVIDLEKQREIDAKAICIKSEKV